MKRRFSNPYIKNIRRRPLDFVRLCFGHFEDLLPISHAPKGFQYPMPDLNLEKLEPKATWINHSTYMIDIDGIKILTDPIWSQRCSPLPFVGPKRMHAPGVDLNKLSRVDVVLISHNHYDHLDSYTIKRLHKQFPHIQWYVPVGVKRWFQKRGIEQVKELHWWEEAQYQHPEKGVQLSIHSVPAQHNSGRGIFDMNRSLWMGFVVTCLRASGEAKRLYFVGDTAYNDFDFKRIGKRFPKIDLCLCPIGTYRPGGFMRTVHSSPEDAVNIHRDVGATLSLGMHWRTFRLSTEEVSRPPYDLFLAMKKYNLNPQRFLPIEPGTTVNW